MYTKAVIQSIITGVLLVHLLTHIMRKCHNIYESGKNELLDSFEQIWGVRNAQLVSAFPLAVFLLVEKM